MEKLIKKLREIIKKIIFNPFEKKFRIFFKGPIDLGQDHALL